jgi:hypothetical protein
MDNIAGNRPSQHVWTSGMETGISGEKLIGTTTYASDFVRLLTFPAT